MTAEMLFVFVVLTVTIIVFIWDRFRMDIVALTVMTTLAVSGIITPAEAVAGFGSTVLLMIAGLFIVGEGLMRTGIAAITGQWLTHVGKGSSTKLLLFLLPLVAFLSAFMSSTGAVALLIPVVLAMVRKSNMSSGQLMMPLAYASLIGGMITLIGTPPNIIVNGALKDAGLGNFSFFDFTPVGLIILVVAMVYLLTIGQWLLPKGEKGDNATTLVSLATLENYYNIERKLFRLTISADSELVGKTVLEAALRRRYDITIFGIERKERWLSSFVPVLLNTYLLADDTLWFYGSPENMSALAHDYDVEVTQMTQNERQRIQQSFGYAEVIVSPGASTIAGKTLIKANFRDKFGLNVIGIRRDNAVLDINYHETVVKEGDALLLAGDWVHIKRLGNQQDLLVFNTPVELEDAPPHLDRAPYALMVMIGLLIAMTTGLLPNLTAILLAALLMIIFGCVTAQEAYRSLSPTSLVLIAGMLPMATAMEKSGALMYLVSHLTTTFAHVGPMALSLTFFLLTSILSQFISNTATSVLMAPVAVNAAIGLGYAPQPFLMMVAIAASTAFSTPIASPVNTLVLAPGGYRFGDFAKVGIGLQLLVMVVAMAVIPIFFPY